MKNLHYFPRVLSRVVIVGVTLLMAGCGDRKVETGTFIDSAVENLNYRTDSVEGATNFGGNFSYRKSETIEFFIGQLSLGSTVVDALLTPIDLVTDGSIDSTAVINRAVLLQSLDADGDADNGITIPAAAHIAAPPSLDFTQTTLAFAADATALTYLRTVKNDQTAVFIGADAARDHLLASLNNAVATDNSGADEVTASAAPALAGNGEQVILTGVPGEGVSFRWEQDVTNPSPVTLTLGSTAGQNDLTQFQASFIAPQVVEEAIYRFYFIVTDAANIETEAQVDVRITPGAQQGGFGVQPL